MMKLFLDTNIFLHCRPLDELNLHQLTGSDSLTIVFPSVTLRELDDHKTRNSSRTTKDRAGRVLREVEKAISSSTQLKGGMSVELFPQFPKKQIEQLGLNAMWNDDVLIASVIAYAEIKHESEVAVLSQDIGVRLRCREYGIETFEIPSDFLLDDDGNETENENRRLKRELEQVRNAQPRLEAGIHGFDNPSWVARFKMKPWPEIDQEKLNVELERIQNAVPKMDIPGRTIGALTAAASLDNIPASDIREYNEKLDRYYGRMGDYFHHLHARQEIANRTISFEIEIQNTGTAPADDVDVLFKFPDGFRLMTQKQLPRHPEEPRPPEKPVSYLQRFAQSQHLMSNLLRSEPYLPRVEPISAFKITETNSYDVTDHFRRIKHGLPVTLPKLYVQFPSVDECKSFECRYELRPANSPEAFAGRLSFVVQNER